MFNNKSISMNSDEGLRRMSISMHADALAQLISSGITDPKQLFEMTLKATRGRCNPAELRKDIALELKKTSNFKTSTLGQSANKVMS